MRLFLIAGEDTAALVNSGVSDFVGLGIWMFSYSRNEELVTWTFNAMFSYIVYQYFATFWAPRHTLYIRLFKSVLFNNTVNFFRLYSVGVVHEEAGGLVE
jgi:hypothetical protein